MSKSVSRIRVVAAAAVLAAAALSQAGLDVPAYSSHPGADYTIYLDFGGFSYSGTWGGLAPGYTHAYGNDADFGHFSDAEKANIKEVWARVSEKYTGMNVNVTTVDPAVAAGASSSDSTRQTYYDNTNKVMHTVIGGNGSWIGGGGYSYIGTTQSTWPGLNGAHTNWVFADEAPDMMSFIGEATAHENGHGLSLNHQSDVGRGEEYSTNNWSMGDGSYAPTMGDSYYSQRGLYRVGTMSNGTLQNDVQVLLNSNTGMGGLQDDGIGHSLATATALAASGGVVDTLASSGFIVPTSSSSPTPLGVDSYTKDVFSFNTDGTALSLTLNAGAQRIKAGVADPGATFDGTLSILDAKGNLVGTGIRDSSTLFSTFSGTLAAGQYYALVQNWGGYTSTQERNAYYYTMGSYFLSGRGGFQAVPEPSTLAALGLGALAFLKRRKKA